MTTETDDYMSAIPQKARIGDGTIKIFKPAFDDIQVIKELDIHSRILHTGLKGKIRVVNLHSILISKDVEMMIGLLFDVIPSIGESLQNSPCKMASEHHAKWERQVTAIVKELHSHDTVWGDIHPGNIVIDENFDAWLVDFGYGWTEDFADRKKPSTNEGDWERVQRIFEKRITQ